MEYEGEPAIEMQRQLYVFDPRAWTYFDWSAGWRRRDSLRHYLGCASKVEHALPVQLFSGEWI